MKVGSASSSAIAGKNKTIHLTGLGKLMSRRTAQESRKLRAAEAHLLLVVKTPRVRTGTTDRAAVYLDKALRAKQKRL